MASLTDNINYLQPTGFKIILDRTYYQNLTFFATSFIHPSTALGTTIVGRSRTDVRLIGDKLTFGDVQCNIILDEDMAAVTEMYDWMQNIVNNTRNSPTGRTQTERSTECDMSVIALNSMNNATKTITYKDAFPTALGDINFDTVSGDNFITVPMTFAFTTFELS
jgi:hypothetical protein